MSPKAMVNGGSAGNVTSLWDDSSLTADLKTQIVTMILLCAFIGHRHEPAPDLLPGQTCPGGPCRPVSACCRSRAGSVRRPTGQGRSSVARSQVPASGCRLGTHAWALRLYVTVASMARPTSAGGLSRAGGLRPALGGPPRPLSAGPSGKNVRAGPADSQDRRRPRPAGGSTAPASPPASFPESATAAAPAGSAWTDNPTRAATSCLPSPPWRAVARSGT